MSEKDKSSGRGSGSDSQGGSESEPEESVEMQLIKRRIAAVQSKKADLAELAE